MTTKIKNKEGTLKDKIKANKGITLIALVITIIVLLILAGVSIAMLTGQNGILTQAQNAKDRTAEAEEQEREDLDKQNQLIENIVAGGNGSGGNLTLPSTEDTKPFLPDGATVTNNDLSAGVTIRDSKGNEWVWIEVPKSIYTNTEYNGGTAPTSSEDYGKIESVMQEYAKDYRKSGFEDTWYSEAQHGFASAEAYNDHKNKMLKSVYENGGFYIGKYEVGTETLRNTADAELTTPVIKEGAYPYNYVTCKQAQERSGLLATGGRTSSLMFGIQWDLVMKHIEKKQGKTKEELKTKSTEWGNYLDSTFNITKGKYSEDSGETYSSVSEIYSKQQADDVILTAGATTRNSTLNIYDLAGNLSEWILEECTLDDARYPCVIRGGNYKIGENTPVSKRGADGTTGNNFYSGFRPALW